MAAQSSSELAMPEQIAHAGFLGHSLDRFAVTAPVPGIALSQPDDPDEVEAVRLATAAMSSTATPETSEQRGDETPSVAVGHSQRAQRTPASISSVPIVRQAIEDGGTPLPNSTRERMETRFHHDFAAVRLHAGDRASQSAAALRARAYTVGGDIVLGRDGAAAGGDSESSLLAHELAHVVQHTSSSTPSGDSLRVLRDPDPAVAPFAGPAQWPPINFPLGKPRHADMEPVNWDTATQATTYPDNPAPISIAVGYMPRPPASLTPKVPDFSQPDCQPGHHQPRTPKFDFDSLPDFQRMEAWSAWETTTGALVTTWNDSATRARAFENAASDPTLAEIDGFNLGPNAGNVHQAANAQQVGGQGPKKQGSTAVGDLFQNINLPPVGNISIGTDVVLDAQTKAGFAKASGKLDDEKGAVERTNNVLKEALLGVKASLHGITEKTDLREAARGKLDLREDEKKSDAQTATLAKLKADKEADMKVVKDLLKVVDLVMKAAEKGVAEAATGAIELALEKVIDASYEDSIKKATEDLAATAKAISDHKDLIASKEFSAAHAALQKAIAEYHKARAGLKTALDDRKEAFRKFSEKAASLSGGDKATQDRMRAVLQAIPVVERVVARIQDVRSSFVVPTYSELSGAGYNMALQASDKSAAQFVTYLGMLKAGRADYDARHTHWTARLASLRAVYKDL